MDNTKTNNRITYYATATQITVGAPYDEMGKQNLSKTETSVQFGCVNDVPPGVEVGTPYVTATSPEFANMFKFGDRVRITIEKA